MVPGLVLTNALAFTTLGLHVTHWASAVSLAEWVSRNRAPGGAVIQVLAQFLAMILIGTLCKEAKPHSFS